MIISFCEISSGKANCPCVLFAKLFSEISVIVFSIKSLYIIGEKKEAIELFEQLLSYCNHVGLYSEDIDFESKRLLGNFPQAYSHLALIETATLISEDGVI